MSIILALTITERVVIQATLYFAVSSVCVFNDGEIKTQASACVKLVELSKIYIFLPTKGTLRGLIY